LDSPFFIANFECDKLIHLSSAMRKVRSKGCFSVKNNSVLYLALGDDNSKT